MALFRCKRSGHLVTFTSDEAIAELRLHEGYEEIRDEKAPENANEENANETDEKRQVLKRKYTKRK